MCALAAPATHTLFNTLSVMIFEFHTQNELSRVATRSQHVEFHTQNERSVINVARSQHVEKELN